MPWSDPVGWNHGGWSHAPAGGGGGGGTFAFVGSKSVAAGPNGGSTTALNTTGSSLIVVAVSRYSAGPAVTLSDSASNTWTALTESINTTGSLACRLYYCANPTTSASHTFTVAGTGIYSSLAAVAFSGGTNASPFDLENGATGTSASATSGGITPSQNNEAVVIATADDGAIANASIDGGFTRVETQLFGGGDHFGLNVAYLIQTTAAAANPTFTYTNTPNWACRIASFKP